MEVTIKTKFNIGDAIYTVGLCHDGFYAYSKPCIIKTILIQRHATTQSVSYRIELENGFIDTMPEQWCFATYDECVEWCRQQR